MKNEQEQNEPTISNQGVKGGMAADQDSLPELFTTEDGIIQASEDQSEAINGA